MKKINIFNRNIDLPSYRHMPVSRGIVENRHTAEARCPGIAIAMTCPAGDFSSQGDEKHNVCDASFCIRKNRIPAFAGMTAKICGITMIVIAALFAVPAMAEGKNSPTQQDETAQKTVTSKYYVDQELATKQDTITIDKVLFTENPKTGENIYVPAIVATNAAGTALNGNTIGVLDRDSIGNTGHSFLYDSFYTGNNSLNTDNFVPTVHAVAVTLSNIKASKQDILSGTAGNVVTYTSTAGSVSSTAVSSAATYNGATLTNGGHIANIAAVETKQDKMTCAGYVPGHENDINYCWLYGDIQVAAAAAPSCVEVGSTCDQNNPCCSGLSCMPSKGGGFVCNYQ